MRVDVHAHYLPPGFFELMEGAGALEQIDAFKVFGPMLHPASQRLFEAGPEPVVEEWLTQLEGADLDLAMLSVGAVQPYFPQAGPARRLAREANLMLREAVVLGRGQLGAFGSLPLPHVEASLVELAFCLDECEMGGINLGTSACGLPLDAAAFDEVWAALDERRATVFLHPGTTPLMAVGSGDFHLAPDFCSPTETAIALCRLVARKVTTRYPNVRLIAVAMGGSLPFFAQRFESGMRRSDPELVEELGGIVSHLRRLWYDTSMIDEPRALDAVRHSLGVDRLVFGSDLPRVPIAEALDFVTGSPLLDVEERRAIIDRNGAVALGLEPVATAASPR